MSSSFALDDSALRAALALAAAAADGSMLSGPLGGARVSFGAFPGLGDQQAFERSLELASQAGSGAAGRAAAQAVVERFVRPIPPAAPVKARRLRSMLSCPGFGPNLRFEVMPDAFPEGSGLPQPTLRPLEFAIDQFLASSASPAWAQTVLALADHPSFAGALDRRLSFSVVKALSPDSGGGDIIERSLQAAFAPNFLMREAGNLPGSLTESIANLVLALEERMGEKATREMQAERDAMRYLGSFSDSPEGAAESRREAARDIRPARPS
jgi:hypothetical protein